ncbi:hypothetical protein T07_9194 [Trichinella nelsoni]|uniref:Uncharacterized protein n=1 Tax=Trichinella nelsoni TaxID=6336 RepID=A0A0V0RPT0_9BILA|nr:hypothetical protein T07_9194 [Trichinella nelsoni]
MRIICTTHNVSEAKITNQLIDTCATYSSVDALLYGQPDGCYLAPGVVRRLTAVCKEPTHFPSGEAPQQSCARTTNTLLQMSNNRLSNLADEDPGLPLLRSVIERDHNIRFTMSTPCTTNNN